MKRLTLSPILATACISLTLVACVSGEGDSAWREDIAAGGDGSAVSDLDCTLDDTSNGLTLKVCNLPAGSTLNVVHTANGTATGLQLEGNNDRARALPVANATAGDTLALGEISVALPQTFLVNCAFVNTGSNGTLQEDGSLVLGENIDNAVQTVHCGREHFVSAHLGPPTGSGEANSDLTLRVDVDRAQASWWRDSQGQPVSTAFLSSTYMFANFVNAGLFIRSNDPDTGELVYGITRTGKDGDFSGPIKYTDADGNIANLIPPGTISAVKPYLWQSLLRTEQAPGTIHFSSNGQLLQTDGTSDGTTASTLLNHTDAGLVDGRLTGFYLAGDNLYLNYYQPQSDTETSWKITLWRKSLTTGSIVQLSDSSNPSLGPTGDETSVATLGEDLFFVDDYSVWHTNGTSPAVQLAAIDSGYNRSSRIPKYLTVFDNTVYFIMNKSQLWRSDGTASGTYVVFDAKNYANYSEAELFHLVSTDGFLAFSALLGKDSSGIPIRALYRSNGTAAGTEFIASPSTVMPNTDIYKYSGDSGLLHVVGNRIIFGDDGSNYRNITNHLWSTDGTAEGTVRLFPNAEVSQTYSASACPLYCVTSPLFVINDRLLVRARNMITTDTGEEYRAFYWISDGTPDGTHVITDASGDPFSYATKQ